MTTITTITTILILYFTCETRTIVTDPPVGAVTLVVRVAGADCVVVLVLTLEVVFTVLAQGGGGHTVSGEVHHQARVTLTLSGVQGTPATQLPALTPPLVSAHSKYQTCSCYFSYERS